MQCSFVEIGHANNNNVEPGALGAQEDHLMDFYICRVQPMNCAKLIKRVSQLIPKDERLLHLKRVRKPKSQRKDDGQEPANKKSKGDSCLLEVVLAVACDDTRLKLEPAVRDFSLELEVRKLPARSAESKEELNAWNNMWPTIYFHERSTEHKKKQLELTAEEIERMEKGIKLALEDGRAAPKLFGGAVILCPETGNVIARAAAERSLQGHANNPLMTPTLLAIQGVSRRERKAACGHGMESTAFKNGQYLCTGFDLYLTREPDVYEAMALVHSRIRRVVFAVVNSHDGGLGGSGALTAVHGLSGTNHHYRAFRCDDGRLLDECTRLHSVE